MDAEKVEKHRIFFQEKLESQGLYDIDGFLLALCYVKQGDLKLAQRLFEKSILEMLSKENSSWFASAQADWLVNVWIMSGRFDLHIKVSQELERFRREKMKSIGNSPVTRYSQGIIELLYPTGADFREWIQVLTKSTKYKDLFAIGQAFESILDLETYSFNIALNSLLKAHEKIAKFGMLRETPEGFICMPAMALAYVAYTMGMAIDVKSDYFSHPYFEYLIELVKRPDQKSG